MRQQHSSESWESLALIALRRAARKAVELAKRTGTPAYVLENGKIVDIARRPAKSGNKARHRRGR